MEDIERFLLKEQFADEEEVLRTKNMMSERAYQEYLIDEACINWAYDYGSGWDQRRLRRRSEHPKTDWRKELMKHFGVVDPLVLEELTEEEEEEWRKCTRHPNYNNAKKNNKKKEKIEEKIREKMRVKNREKNRKKNRKRREKRQLKKSKNKDHDAQDNEKQEINSPTNPSKLIASLSRRKIKLPQ